MTRRTPRKPLTSLTTEQPGAGVTWEAIDSTAETITCWCRPRVGTLVEVRLIAIEDEQGFWHFGCLPLAEPTTPGLLGWRGPFLRQATDGLRVHDGVVDGTCTHGHPWGPITVEEANERLDALLR